MSTAEERIEVFQDTLDWIKSDPDLSASIPIAKQATTVFFEDDYPDFNQNSIRNTHISVSKDRSFQAAIRLHKEDPVAKIAVMNFANAFHPGGGVVKGASAQEECLCRTSTLYPLLYRKTLRDTFYRHHHDLGTSKASDSLIYTERVIVCKTDEDLPKRMPKKDWISVDVITIAAPDLRTKSNKYIPLTDGGTYMNNAELFGYHVKRAIHMLTCAAAKGADILVLGAFGCGAFQNDPEVVAQAYKTAIEEFPKVFKKIEFAVYCSPRDENNYRVFNRVFGQNLQADIALEPKVDNHCLDSEKQLIRQFRLDLAELIDAKPEELDHFYISLLTIKWALDDLDRDIAEPLQPREVCKRMNMQFMDYDMGCCELVHKTVVRLLKRKLHRDYSGLMTLHNIRV